MYYFLSGEGRAGQGRAGQGIPSEGHLVPSFGYRLMSIPLGHGVNTGVSISDGINRKKETCTVSYQGREGK